VDGIAAQIERDLRNKEARDRGGGADHGSKQDWNDNKNWKDDQDWRGKTNEESWKDDKKSDWRSNDWKDGGGGGGPAMRPGDWSCPGCGDHQFGKNSECRKCGAPKPQEGGYGGREQQEKQSDGDWKSKSWQDKDWKDPAKGGSGAEASWEKKDWAKNDWDQTAYQSDQPKKWQDASQTTSPSAGVDTRDACGDFKRGNCDRGDRCRYSHVDAGQAGQQNAWGKMNAEAAAQDSWPQQNNKQGWPEKENWKDSSKATLNCDHGHPLTQITTWEKGRCDKCSKSFSKGATVQRCNSCDYDVCENCSSGRAPDSWKEKKEKKDKKEKKEKRRGPAQPDKLDGENWEEPKENVGLVLVKDMAPDRNWEYPLYDDSRRCYAGFLRNPWSKQQCDMMYEQIKNDTEWLQPKNGKMVMPRKTAWMVKAGCSCTYAYGPFEVPATTFPPWMLALLGEVMPICGLTNEDSWPDSCNMNLYADGGAAVGWHADDEALFQGKFSDIMILSLSLGVSRQFELRYNWPEAGDQAEQSMTLQSGDLMTMEGMVQKHLQHRIPKEGRVQGPRINLTWRWVRKHTPKCPAARLRR